ncbi:MAG: NAD(P)H nitroreductase [Pseudonocardia sp.]|uniref:Acg family FMN-binding oxidoreductase n=1 Tax=unclassified Pseudonocardia TaxID=2619320 RepID=UPI00086AE15E|nr:MULTISPECIES: NAD(P)H nitroreductase [unclassified Pseudonocardia]MBN9110795.1 NAD(P)H nitroreductase [Pseudonocardia sp.]ODU27162.1 MAG: hypothetical protein ABS80_04835 [Pseudonocardia sp. SCN 72-51]ODV04484.1 MAG: hypothetical protein ABT15_21220 [Pseudonocardia sp. SCN 73-27]
MLDLSPASTVRSAIDLACMAPSVHNSQPWRWLVGPHTVHLYADLRRWLPATDPDGRDMVISCGAALDHLRIALQASGHRPAVHRLPNPADGDHLAAVELRSNQYADADLSLVNAVPARRSDRRPYGSWPVPAAFVDELVAAGNGRGALVHLVEPGERPAVVRAIREAEAVQSAQPGYDTELALWSGAVAGPDGVPAANLLDDPAAGGPASRRFAPGSVTPAPGRSDDAAELLIIATSSDDALSWLRAGEALSAIALRAVDLGLASCPLSAPLEVPATRVALRDGVLGGAAMPQVALRVGWPPPGSLPRTPRRSLDDVIAEMTV